MLSRAVLAVLVGIMTWVVVAFIGMLVGRFLDGGIGSFITNVSVLFGVVAALWYYLTGQTPDL